MSWRQHQQPTGNWRGGGGDDGGDGSARETERPMPTLVHGNLLMVRSTNLYQGVSRALEVPCVLGSYSVDGEKNIHFDDSMMAVISEKYIPRDTECMKVELDLNKGCNRINDYTSTTIETFYQFLQWILKNQKKLTVKDSPNKLADFVCPRGILKSILQAPYKRFENMNVTILAQHFKGSIYMAYQYEDEEDQKKKDKNQCLSEIYGQKFEQYMTGGDPDEVLDCNCMFRCVVKNHLNELTLLYPIPTDAVDKSRYQHNFKDMSSFVSLKAFKECIEPYKQRNYRKYTLNGWWADSQLSGIPRLLKGIRTHEGIVHTLQMLLTADLPDQAEGEWEPSVCINFLVKFLNFVKEKVLPQPHKVHRFERSSSAREYFLHSHDTSVKDLLPMWYREQFCL